MFLKRAGFALPFLLAACSSLAPSPRLVIPEDFFQVPTLAAAPGGCRPVGLEHAILRGHRDDLSHASVWLDHNGSRINVVFPPGYQALFNPSLEILDRAGATVARDGDAVNGGCTTGPNADGPLLILYPPTGS